MQADEPNSEASENEPASAVTAERLEDLRRRLLAASTMGEPDAWPDSPSDSSLGLLDNIVQLTPRALRGRLATH